MACCASWLMGRAWGEELTYAAPERLVRPDSASDEAGLWATMDREERHLRRGPFLIRDPALKQYVQDIACRLAGDHCPDVRVHLVRNAVFNANMAPNGMMQLWSGLLLRAENEAQLAAIIGHEMGHYLQRHTLERLRDLKAKSAFGQFLSAFGLAGAVGNLAVMATAFAYGRDQEREADRIGAVLMHRAGYDVAEGASVWRNLLAELTAREGREPEKWSPLFATHPAAPERMENMEQYAEQLRSGDKGVEAFRRHTAPHQNDWVREELKRAQYAESIALFTRLLSSHTDGGLMHFGRGEAYRLRAEAGDVERAMEDLRAASQHPSTPAETHRGLGLLARQRGEVAAARAALSRYLELAPDAPDAPLIQDHLTELPS